MNWSVLEQVSFTGICCYSCAASRMPECFHVSVLASLVPMGSIPVASSG